MFLPCEPPLAVWLAAGLNLVTAAILVWVTAIGGVVGSFLNVVIYRLPAGESVVFPGSRCPRCLQAIRWYDNVPVLSWLWLRGRCRDCGTPIAIRYPLVEAFVAALFLALAYGQWLGGGENLPLRAFDHEPAPVPPGFELLAGITLVHALLLTTLVAAALIEADGHLPPGLLFLPGLLIALGAPLFWPELRPLPWSAHCAPWQARWLDPLPALAAGMLASWITWPARTHGGRRIDGHWATNGDWWLVGLALGWQATLFVAAAAAAFHLAWTVLHLPLRFLPRIPFAGWMFVAVALLLAGWRSLAQATGGALSTSTLAWAVGAIAAALACSWIANLLAPTPSGPPAAAAESDDALPPAQAFRSAD